MIRSDVLPPPLLPLALFAFPFPLLHLHLLKFNRSLKIKAIAKFAAEALITRKAIKKGKGNLNQRQAPASPFTQSKSCMSINTPTKIKDNSALKYFAADKRN